VDPTERAARLVKILREEEFRTLRSVESVCMSSGPSNVERIIFFSRLPKDRVIFALEELNSKKLIMRQNSSYLLNQTGIEVLALKEYVRRNLVEALGKIIAKGKESDVYLAFGPNQKSQAIKFFKLGRISFRTVRKKRFVERSEVRNWISVNYDAAKREFMTLKKLKGHQSYPEVISYNRNTILMSYIEGIRLSSRPGLENPREILDKIIEALRFAYNRGVINGDMSEYNVLTDGEKVWLIDWPQAVGIDHPNSSELLDRDVSNILDFFRRVYSVSVEKKHVIDYIKG
jgi:RIO kinase 2